jgi:peptidoglycan/LPS O-acetylase OafA/YrhL
VVIFVITTFKAAFMNLSAVNLSGARSLGSAISAHDNGFNPVRLVAALLVVVFHSWQLNGIQPNVLDPISRLIAPVSNLGQIAVGVFFMISGIFVTQSWMRDPNLIRFTLRRITRILPGLVICLLLTTLIAVVFFSTTGWRGLFSPEPWRYILHNSMLHWLAYNIPPEHLFVPGVLQGQALNGSLWTLYWEARMYIVLALIGCSAILPMREWFKGVAIFFLLSAILIPQVLSGYIWEVQLWSLFLVGVLLNTFADKIKIGPKHLLCAIILLALNWTRSAALTPSGFTFFGIALVCCALALWIGTSRPAGCAHFQKHDYSFGVYIYHWPVILILRAALPPLSPIYTLIAAVLVVLPVSMLSWHLIEAPALKWLRKRVYFRELE